MIDLAKSEGIQNEAGVWALRLTLSGAVLADLPDEDLTASLLAGLDRFLSMDGVTPRWLRNPRTQRWVRFDRTTLDQHRTWIAGLGPDQPFELAVSDGERWQDAAENFCAIARAAGALRRRGTRSYIRFAFPRGMAQAAPDTAISFVADVAGKLHADSGWCGLGLTLSPDESIAAAFLHEEFTTAQRFEGIDVGSVAITSVAARAGIKGVNWLTILGSKWLEPLGGLDGLSNSLSGVALVIPFEHGAIVRAGDHPVLGDRNRREPAQSYHAVGRVLAPVRTQRHVSFHDLSGPQYFGEAETREWLARFD